MKARDIMTADPVSVTPDTPVEEAARLMKDQNVGMLPVVDARESKRLIGVITDRDITVRTVAEGQATESRVKEAMTERVATCRPDTDVGEVMDLMGREQVRRIPIVDERGSLVGVVAQADVVLHAKDEKKAEHTIEEISQPYGKHSQ